MEDRAAKSTMSEQFVGAERRIANLNTQLGEIQLSLERLTGESCRKKADPCTQIVAAEKTHNVESALVNCFQGYISAVAEKRQLFLAERRERSETARCQLAETGK